MNETAPVLKRKPDADRRAVIVAIARPIFLSEGYAATSMSAIAAQLGGSKGTLYNYFPSKEELFLAVAENACEEFLALVYDAELEGMDVRPALREVGRRLLKFGLADEQIAAYRLVVAESTRFPAIGRILSEKGLEKALARLAAYLKGAMTKGLLRKADAEIAAEQFFELCNAGLFHLRVWNVAPMPSEAEIARRVDIATDTFLRAYGA